MNVSLSRRISQRLREGVRNLVTAGRRARERRAGIGALSRLDDRLLQDIGLSRHEVTALELGRLSLGELAERREAFAAPQVAERFVAPSAAVTGRRAPNDARYRNAENAA